MTVREIIERLEETEDLDRVIIDSDEMYCVYELDDIDYIDEKTLNSPVQLYQIRMIDGGRRMYRVVYIEC